MRYFSNSQMESEFVFTNSGLLFSLKFARLFSPECQFTRRYLKAVNLIQTAAQEQATLVMG